MLLASFLLFVVQFLLSVSPNTSIDCMSSTSPLLSEVGAISGHNGDFLSDKIRLYQKCKQPTKELNSAQKCWIAKHLVVTSLVVIGVNFGLTRLSMLDKPTPTLWDFPTPMAGTYAVTMLIQVTLNWMIGGSVMTLEVLRGEVEPLEKEAVAWWPAEARTQWWLDMSDMTAPSNEHSHLSFCQRFVWSLCRVAPWHVYTFVLIWPICVAISWAVWGDDHYNAFPWQPEIMVAVLGVAINIVTLPIWGVIVLAVVGERCFDVCV